MTKHPVDSYQAIEAIMAEGYKNRSIASHALNTTSSRAHTIITIELRQIEELDGVNT